MTPETYKYFLIGLFSIVVIGSFYLVFKSGFKLKKQRKSKPLFTAKNRGVKRSDFLAEILIGGTFVLFLVLLDKCSN